MWHKLNRSQTLTEYVLLIILSAAVLLTMRIFLLRALQEKFRQAGDVFGGGEQFSKNLTTNSSRDTGTLYYIPEEVSSAFDCRYVLKTEAQLNQQISGCYAKGHLGDVAYAQEGIEDQIQGLDKTIANLTEQKAAVANGNADFLAALSNNIDTLIKAKDSLIALRVNKENELNDLRESHRDCFEPAGLPQLGRRECL